MSIQINDSKVGSSAPEERSVSDAMWRGAKQKCPNCGEGELYSSYLKVNDECPKCGEELHHQRADDAPPYFTMFIVGHFVVAAVLAVEEAWAPSLWVHALLWTPACIIPSLWMLPRVKGILIGLQWAYRMHGFGGVDEEAIAAEKSLRPAD